LVRTIHNICKVRDSNLNHHRKKDNIKRLVEDVVDPNIVALAKLTTEVEKIAKSTWRRFRETLPGA